MTMLKRIKNLLTTRRLCEVGAIFSGLALTFWWLLPRLAQWIINIREGYVPFISYGIEG